MSGSIPQWVTNTESDETNYKNHRLWTLIYLIVLLIAFLIIVTIFGDNLSNRYIIGIIFFILLIFIFARLDSLKRNLPNLLAANLYRIGTELETFDSSSPSFLKRNQQYFKKCENLLNYLMVRESYFIEDYKTFLNNIYNIIIRINYFYSKNLKPTNGSISSDLIELAEEIHDNYANLLPVHTAYVNGILSDLGEIPQPPNKFSRNKLVKSVNTGWANLRYSYRAVITLLFIGIIIFIAASFVMNNTLGMEKTVSYGYASIGTFTLIAAMITQIDKIVPK